MTVPTPREDLSGVPTQMFGMVSDGLRDVKEAVTQLSRDMHEQLAKLPETYVARREFDRYRDERSVDFQSAQTRHDRDIADLKADADRRAEEARQHRRWLIGTVLTLVGLIVAVALTYIH